MEKHRKIIVGSRASKLAITQTELIISYLIEANKEKNLEREKDFEVFDITNSVGDKNQSTELYNIGGAGVFTKQLEVELLNNTCDFVVHSLKDLPTSLPEKLILASIPQERAPRSDAVLINHNKFPKEVITLSHLPEGSVVGTSSLRRICALKKRFPLLKYENIRGNLDTRIKKMNEGLYDAIILAEAGLRRLGYQHLISDILDMNEFLYAPGQGALAIECRADDHDLIALLKTIEGKETRASCECERTFLRVLEAGCTMPVAVCTTIQGLELKLVGEVFDRFTDESIRMEYTGSIDNPNEIGTELALKMKEKGAMKFIDKVKNNK